MVKSMNNSIACRNRFHTNIVTIQRKINCNESIQIKANIFPTFVKRERVRKQLVSLSQNTLCSLPIPPQGGMFLEQ